MQASWPIQPRKSANWRPAHSVQGADAHETRLRGPLDAHQPAVLHIWQVLRRIRSKLRLPPGLQTHTWAGDT